jgi:hypothetical protein
MNVYVISNVWDHSGSTVIGAATDRTGAEQIANRQPEREELRGAWAPWVERVDPAEGSCWWERVALLTDGTVHPSLSQEIVCVPLAGFIGDWPIKGLTTEGLATAAPALMKPEIGGEVRNDPLGIFTAEPGPMPTINSWVDQANAVIGFVPKPGESVTYPWAGSDHDARDAMHDAMETVLAARRATERAGGYVDRIDVGAGAGLAYFQRAADTLPKMPDGSSWQVFSGASIAGLRIVVDTDIRPDQIRIGSVIYTIGTGDNGIPEGNMIRVDVAEVGEQVVDAIRARLTTEPD